MKIEHIAIYAEDIEKLRDFYTRYFGLTCGPKYENRLKMFTSYFLYFGEGKTRIEIMNVPTLPKGGEANRSLGLAHFAIAVGSKEKVNELTEQLRADGYTIVSEPRTTGDGYYESAVADPEGNYVEITA